MNRKIIRLAIPNIISNITIPLVGMVDLAIVGRLEGGTPLAGIAIGTTIFNMLYWNFGFLRMGTSGLTAQAYGKRNFDTVFKTLFRALSVALIIAIIMLTLQIQINWLALAIMRGATEVEQLAADYFFLRIWAAPATLALYAFQGWYIGMQNAKTPMYIAIFINIVNIITSSYFALSMGMGLNGIALGTVIAQWSGVIMAGVILWVYYGKIFKVRYLKKLYDKESIGAFFRVNRDIFIRTICLVMVFTFFTSASSAMGSTILSSNTLILQLFTLFSYIMDGFAYSGEALTGRYYGSGSKDMLRHSVTGLFKWGAILATIFTLIYVLFGESILRIFTDESSIIATTKEYIWWAAAIPIAGFSAFLMDGILVGISQAKLMRNTMIISSCLFFAVYYSLVDTLGNNAIWLAFLLFLAGRGILQIIFSYRLIFKK